MKSMFVLSMLIILVIVGCNSANNRDTDYVGDLSLDEIQDEEIITKEDTFILQVGESDTNYYTEIARYQNFELGLKRISLLKAGEIVIDDLAKLNNYPEFDCGLRVNSSSTDARFVFLSEQACGGGIALNEIYLLDTDNGFSKIENFATTDYEYSDKPLIGIGNRAETNTLYILDINGSKEPEIVYESKIGTTFMFPSFYGDEYIKARWINDNQIEVEQYLVDELSNIDPGNELTYPKPELVIVNVN